VGGVKMIIVTGSKNNKLPTSEDMIAKIEIGEDCYVFDEYGIKIMYDYTSNWIVKFTNDNCYYGSIALGEINKVVEWLNEYGRVE
jgi:hypothetical protein